MKVLIVAEQLDIQDYLRHLNPDPSIHFFQYTHPLKAMDNLEEIQPSLILWNVDDFPRHWKSFLPYCHALFPSSMPQFHLVSETALPKEEDGKAEELLVNGIHTQGFYSEELAELLEAGDKGSLQDLHHNIAPVIPPGRGTIQLQHPVLHRLLIGELLSADQKSLLARFPDLEAITVFQPNLIIDHAFFCIDFVSLEVMLRVSVVNQDGTCQFLIMQFL